MWPWPGTGWIPPPTLWIKCLPCTFSHQNHHQNVVPANQPGLCSWVLSLESGLPGNSFLTVSSHPRWVVGAGRVVFAAELAPCSRNVNHKVTEVGKDLQAHQVQCVNPHVLEQNWTSLPRTLSSLSIAWSGEVLSPGALCVDPGVPALLPGHILTVEKPQEESGALLLGWSHSLAAGQDLSC